MREKIPSFQILITGEKTFAELEKEFDYKNFAGIINELYDEIEQITASATDKAVDFVPNDPNLKEPGEEGWTLGHVIVHVTAGMEEVSAISAMMARGVPVEGRLRYEIPWETVHTVAQIRHRLTESRRMVLAFLDAWPDEPHFETSRDIIPRFGPMNCVGNFLLGLMHTNGHLAQFREIMRQAEELN